MNKPEWLCWAPTHGSGLHQICPQRPTEQFYETVNKNIVQNKATFIVPLPTIPAGLGFAAV